MPIDLKPESICVPSEDVIAREIEGEMLIVPIVAGMVHGDDALYTLSPTADRIWKHLDGKNSLEDIINILSQAYEGGYDEIKEDVLGFVNEMVDLSIIKIMNN